jgi:tRNA(Ile2) C34 agmatinyltransferase TiaS
MGALDYLKELEGRVLDAKSYQLLRRNYELQEENNQHLNDKIKHLESEVSILRERNEQLTAESKDLLKKVKEFEAREKYKIHKGIAFKVNQDGSVEPTPYCPNCNLTMSDAGIGIYKCPKCGYVASPMLRADVLAQQLNSQSH